jgi:hypothetical protein
MVRDSDGWGKTDDPRPCMVSREERDLRHRLAFEDLDFEAKVEVLQRIMVLTEERKYGNRK